MIVATVILTYAQFYYALLLSDGPGTLGSGK